MNAAVIRVFEGSPGRDEWLRVEVFHVDGHIFLLFRSFTLCGCKWQPESAAGTLISLDHFALFCPTVAADLRAECGA